MHKIKNYDHVNRISRILNYELASSVLFMLSFIHGIFLAFASIAAIIFALYLLYVLFNEERYGWAVTFIILISFPILLSIPLGLVTDYFSIISMITLLLFYLFCFMIKSSVKEWINEYNWAEQLEAQKREKIDKQNNFNITDIM